MILADEAFDGQSGNFLDLYWMLGDHQGSVTSVLSHNSGQTSLVQQLAYTAFGAIGSIKDGQGNNVTTGPISRFAYTGREFDPETGDYYYRARYYDPQTGRFLSQDPIGFAAGDMNLYRYVGNATPNFVDPSGNACIEISRIYGKWIYTGYYLYETPDDKTTGRSVYEEGLVSGVVCVFEREIVINERCTRTWYQWCSGKQMARNFDQSRKEYEYTQTKTKLSAQVAAVKVTGALPVKIGPIKGKIKLIETPLSTDDDIKANPKDIEGLCLAVQPK